MKRYQHGDPVPYLNDGTELFEARRVTKAQGVPTNPRALLKRLEGQRGELLRKHQRASSTAGESELAEQITMLDAQIAELRESIQGLGEYLDAPTAALKNEPRERRAQDTKWDWLVDRTANKALPTQRQFQSNSDTRTNSLLQAKAQAEMQKQRAEAARATHQQKVLRTLPSNPSERTNADIQHARNLAQNPPAMDSVAKSGDWRDQIEQVESALATKERYRGKGVGKRGGWDKGVPRGKRAAHDMFGNNQTKTDSYGNRVSGAPVFDAVRALSHQGLQQVGAFGVFLHPKGDQIVFNTSDSRNFAARLLHHAGLLDRPKAFHPNTPPEKRTRGDFFNVSDATLSFPDAKSARAAFAYLEPYADKWK